MNFIEFSGKNVMHKNESLSIKLWWFWDVESLQTLEGLAGGLSRSFWAQDPCLPQSSLLTLVTVLWPSLGQSHGLRWWCWGWGVTAILLSQGCLLCTQAVWALPLMLSSLNCNLWCSCAKEKAGICLCFKYCVYIKRLLQQSALHGRNNGT